MPQPSLVFHHVTFAYRTAARPILAELSLHLAPGWCGIVGVNGAGKTTFLKLATGLLNPSRGEIDRPERTVYCPQRTDDPPGDLAGLLDDISKSAAVVRNQLGIQSDWLARWDTLSHGERKRAQIGPALWKEPEVLAIDEPTNHLDADAREKLIGALRAYRGVGLLVSHDREMLDSLCTQCLFLDPPDAVMRPGGYTKGNTVEKEESQAIQRRHDIKRQAYKKLEREAGRRRDLANQSQAKLSKRGIPKHDHDAKGKIDAAILTGRDAVGGRLLRQLEGRLDQAKWNLESVRVKKQYESGIWLPGSASQRDTLLSVPAGSLPLGESKILDYPALIVLPSDRIALTGPNGTGKSTLLSRLLPFWNCLPERITYVPQEIHREDSKRILQDVRSLPREQLGLLMNIVSRLGSRPQRLLESAEPSPGEARKLLLALGMTRSPHLIIMDEPTNHMDIASIECLEEALADCPCALLLVSHDRRFLEKLTQTEWRIESESSLADRYLLRVVL